MAYTNGTAANYKDLLAVLATFAAANGWTALEQSATKLYMRGAGLSGLDEIYVGVETWEDPPNGRYNWELVGSWGWRAGRGLEFQPRSSAGLAQGNLVFTYLWNASIPYWIVANGRRIMGFAKVGTTYRCFYLGLGLPPATTAQYPYPLIIGGEGSTRASGYSDLHCAFWNSANYSPARVCQPGGTWGSINSSGSSASLPVMTTVSANFANKANIITSPDGSYLLEQLYITDTARPSILAAIDGLFRVSGYNNTAENIITVAGVNYMVFPDTNNSGFGDFCAMRLN